MSEKRCHFFAARSSPARWPEPLRQIEAETLLIIGFDDEHAASHQVAATSHLDDRAIRPLRHHLASEFTAVTLTKRRLLAGRDEPLRQIERHAAVTPSCRRAVDLAFGEDAEIAGRLIGGRAIGDDRAVEKAEIGIAGVGDQESLASDAGQFRAEEDKIRHSASVEISAELLCRNNEIIGPAIGQSQVMARHPSRERHADLRCKAGTLRNRTAPGRPAGVSTSSCTNPHGSRWQSGDIARHRHQTGPRWHSGQARSSRGRTSSSSPRYA